MEKEHAKKTLAQMLADKQEAVDATDREVAEIIGVMQQTYSTWKHGRVPGRAWHERICDFLDVSIDELKILMKEQKNAETQVLRLPDFYKATEYGVVTSPEYGEFLFEPVNAGRKRIPEGRYMVIVNTDVMEPAILNESPCWIDISIWPAAGREVMVHKTGGVAIIGQLVSTTGRGATIKHLNPERTIEIDDVLAVHTIVLSQRGRVS